MNSNPQQRLTALIRGRVQGVSFRYYTRQVAQRWGVCGWVRNEIDGAVQVVAEGPAEQLRALEAWLHHGPPAAWVENVSVSYSEASGEFSHFTIR